MTLKCLSLTTLALLFSVQAISQNQKIDSLKALLPLRFGSEYVDLLYELGRANSEIHYGQAFEYADEGYRKALALGDSSRIVKLGRIKAQAFRRLGQLDEAISLFMELLPVARRHKCINDEKIILNGLGLAHHFQGKNDIALKYLFESLDLRKQIGDKYEIQIALNNIGLVYQGLGQFDRAIATFGDALGYSDKSDETIISILTNIGQCLSQKGNYREASEYVQRAIDRCQGNCSSDMWVTIDFNLGLIFFGEEKYIEAGDKFMQSYRLSLEQGDKRYQMQSIEYLIRIYLKRNQMPLAEKYLNKAESIIESGVEFNSEIILVYRQAYETYLRLGNFKKASFYQTKYILYKEKFFNDELTKNLMKFEGEYLERENQIKIESQAKIISLDNEIIQIHKSVNILIGLVTLSLIALVVVLFRSNRQKQKINLLLDKKVQERTQQLEQNRDTLQRACDDRDNLIRKTSMDINNSLATLKGLCALGLKDVEDKQALLYISKMNSTSDSFSEIVSRLRVTRTPLSDQSNT